MTNRTQGISLMFISLGILIIPGLVVNNMTANGLINTNQHQTCDQTLDTCVLDTAVGCQAGTQNCSLQGSSIQFLNACSPFTNILTLNFVGFVTSFFSTCTSQTTQGSSQTTPIVPGAIQGVAGPFNMTSCTTLSSGIIINPTPGNQLNCNSVSPAIVIQAGTITISSTWPTNLVIGSQGTATCPAAAWNGVITNATAGSTATATLSCFDGYILNAGQLQNTVTFTGSCVAHGDYSGTPFASGNLIKFLVCSNLAIYFVATSGPGVSVAPFGTVFNASSIITFLLSILGAAILLLMGLGIGGTVQGSIVASGGAAGITINPQGTKLAQVFGIALLIWSPLYSEFNTWFTSGLLPYGFDSVIGIVSIALIVAFFFGAWSLSQSGSVATTG